MGTKKSYWDAWRPKQCHFKYSTPYEFAIQEEKKSSPPPEPTKPDSEEQPPEIDWNIKWCPGCMRVALEPITLECGHSFCRRCLANLRYPLVEDFPNVVKDTRSVLRCPLKGCCVKLKCLPFINGDFRFWKIRPSDKVSLTRSGVRPCEIAAMKTYKVVVDADVTIRKSDDLFDGFDDVIIIP